MKLPRKYLSDEAISKLDSHFRQNSLKLWGGGTLEIPSVKFGAHLESGLGDARRCRQLRGGLEAIEVLLQQEGAGLARFRSENTSKNSGHPEAVSRLLLMSADGSERFYRHCESLLKRFGDRVAACRLDVPGSVLGRLFFGPDKEVKALLVTKVDLVGRVLEGILADAECQEKPN